MSVDRIAAEWAARDRNPVAAMTTLPEGFSMTAISQPWISVDEQWPPHGSDVLVAYKCGKYIRIGVGEFDGTTVNDDGLTIPYFKGIGGFEVTQWMPLPEPPA